MTLNVPLWLPHIILHVPTHITGICAHIDTCTHRIIYKAVIGRSFPHPGMNFSLF